MNILTQRLPGLPVGLLRMMFGLLWLQAALQKAPWVINAQGQRFGWLSNWLWTETQHPTFGFYKAMLENVVWLSVFRGRVGPGGLPALGPADGPERYWRGAVAVQYCHRELCGAGGMGLDLAPPHCATSRLCLQPCGAQCRGGSVLGPLALQGPPRPDRHWAVSTLLGLRDQQRPGLYPRRVDQVHWKDHGPCAW